MLRISVVVLFLFVISASCGDKYVHKTSGVPLFFTASNEIFPPYWRNDETSPYAESLPPALRPQAMTIISKAMRKYPVDLLKNNLVAIYVLGDLQFYGLKYGGTSSENAVYIVHTYYSSDVYTERTFHHEFVSLLMRKYIDKLDTNAWKALNSPDFAYGPGGVEALASGSSNMDFDYELIEQGFLNEYSLSSVEEDICCMAEQLFVPEYDFWDIYNDYPLLRAKIDYLINFYNSLNTEFNKAAFMKYCENQWPEETADTGVTEDEGQDSLL